MLALALSHIYLLYPLPNQRISQLRGIDVTNQQQASEPGKHESRNELDEMETDIWRGWYTALVLVIATGLLALLTGLARQPVWQMAVLLGSLTYIGIFCVEIMSTVDDFFSLQIRNLSSLYRIGEFARVLMTLQQIIMPVAFLVLAAYATVRLMSRKRGT